MAQSRKPPGGGEEPPKTPRKSPRKTPRKTPRKRAPANSVEDQRRPGVEPVNEKLPKGNDAEQRKLAQMHERAARAVEYWRASHEAGRADVNACYIDQWDPDVRQERLIEQRPTVTINSLPQYVHNTVAAAQKSTIGVKFLQAGGLEEVSAGAIDKQIQLSYAQIMSGIAKMIEVRSNAEYKYTRALQHAVEAGIGWLQVDIHPPPGDPFVNDIWINHIRNRWSVLVDPLACEPDLSDMKWAFVHEMMPLKEFEARYPDHVRKGIHPITSQAGFLTLPAEEQKWWTNNDMVRVVDYYRMEVVDKEYVQLVHPATRERIVGLVENMKDVLDELQEEGFEETGRMTAPTPEVRILRCTWGQILEKEYTWPGMRIPLVPMLGRQIDLQDATYFISQIRYAIEPQMTKNIWASAATEKIMQSPKNPWVIPSSALRDDNVRDKWDNADRQNPFYLPWDDTETEQKPFRNNDATMPTAELQMAGFFNAAEQEAMGIYQATLGQRSNETSGVAIARRQDAGSASQIGFLFNQANCIRSVGDILKDLIPTVYNDDRLVTIINDEGEDLKFHINHYVTDRTTGKRVLMNSLNFARYDLRVSVAPSSVTQREEFAEVMKVLIGNNPMLMQLGGDLIVRALNIPFGDVLAKRLRQGLPPHMLTAAERENMPQREPTPEEVIAQKELETKHKELETRHMQLEAAQVTADAEIKIAKLKLAEANEKFHGNLAEGLANGNGDVSEVDPEEIRKAAKPIVKQLIAEEMRNRRRK